MDAASQERLRSVLRQENRLNGRTLLVASSELSDVESLCPRLLVGVDGRIGFDGDVSALTELIGTERSWWWTSCGRSSRSTICPAPS